MNYTEYKKSRNLSWQVLLNENVTELPVMVGELCRRMGIWIQYYEPADGNDGCSTIIDGQARIFISKNCIPERQRFTAAHELGHILLGHVGRYRLVNREPTEKDNPIEQEANVFASRFLAPACVLWALNAKTPEEIGRLCRISHQAAVFRAERMAILYERGKFLSSPMERAVYAQFSAFIDRQKRLEAGRELL